MWVLSDPDVLSNHGLDEGENAAFVEALFRAALPTPDALIVIDEVIHEHGAEPGFWDELTSFPLVLVPFHLLFLTAVLLWAGMGRFGAPLRARAALGRGRLVLIDNIADLLGIRKHAVLVANRYVEGTVREVAESASLPARTEAWRDLAPPLAEISRHRGLERDPTLIVDEVVELRVRGGRRGTGRERRAFGLAQDIHAWKKEWFDGTD